MKKITIIYMIILMVIVAGLMLIAFDSEEIIKLGKQKFNITNTFLEKQSDYVGIVIQNSDKFDRNQYGEKEYNWFEQYCWSLKENNQYIFTCDSINSEDNLCCYKKVFERELTTEFLNENCECSWAKLLDGEGNYDCKKYKCGGYIVEVRK